MNNILEMLGSYLYSSGERIRKLMDQSKVQRRINKLVSFEIIFIAISLLEKERKITRIEKRLKNLEAQYYRRHIEEHNKAEKE